MIPQIFGRLFRHTVATVLVAAWLLLPQWAIAATPRVVVTIAPLHSLVTAVTQGVTTPDLLLAASASPHDFQLKPSQRRLISQATLIIWVGEDLETPLANVFASLGVTPLGLADYGSQLSLLPYRADAVGHADDGHADDDAAGHETSAHQDEIDPHFWLDPNNAIGFVRQMALLLAEIYPDHSALLQSNAERISDALARDSVTWQKALDPYQDQPLLSAHDGFQYFESAFGLQHVGAIQVNSEVSMSVRRYASLRGLITDLGVTCVFTEPQLNPKQMTGLLSGLDVTVVNLDPMGAALPIGASLYRDMMQANVDAVTGCSTPLR